uniref:Uncharacterized protein n=1 Tax=Anguilla anguilla TaxID=7936 RepID=A0A0E9SLW7_ANGAN
MWPRRTEKAMRRWYVADKRMMAARTAQQIKLKAQRGPKRVYT